MIETPSPAYVASRRIGAATVTVISAGTARWRPNFAVPEEEWRRAIPEADAAGMFTIGFNSVHIRTGAASILIDAGFDDPDSPWGRKFAAEWRDVAFSPGVEAGLETIGVGPEEITHLVTTHGHFDHYVGVTTERDGRTVARFPRARHFLGRADREASRYDGKPDPELTSRFDVIERLGMLELVDGDREIAPGVTMLHAPGESPGHTIIRLSSGGERFYALGDLFHHGCEVAHRDWVLTGRDRASMRASRERLLAEAVPTNATLLFSHDHFPAWGRIVPAERGYRWERG